MESYQAGTLTKACTSLVVGEKAVYKSVCMRIAWGKLATSFLPRELLK